MKGKGGNSGNGVIPVEKKTFKSHTIGNAFTSSNPFMVLSPSEDQAPILEEGEVQQYDVHIEEGEANLGPQEQDDPVILETPSADAYLRELHTSPTRVTSSPSYAKILNNKSVNSSSSSEEDFIEQFTKKEGRKS